MKRILLTLTAVLAMVLGAVAPATATTSTPPQPSSPSAPATPAPPSSSVPQPSEPSSPSSPSAPSSTPSATPSRQSSSPSVLDPINEYLNEHCPSQGRQQTGYTCTKRIPDSLAAKAGLKPSTAAGMPTCQHPKGVPTYTRTYACWTGKFGTHVNIGDPLHPKTLITNGAYEEWLQANSRTWDRVVYAEPVLAQGGWDPSGAVIKITHKCSNPGCPDASKQSFTSGPIQLNTLYSHKFTMTSDGSATVYPNLQSFIGVDMPPFPGGEKGDFGAATGIQCDSRTDVISTQKPGCVYYWYTPNYVIDYKGTMPNIAKNILYGELALHSHPGFPGSNTVPGGQMLVRGPTMIPDPKTGKPAVFKKLSRDVACPESIPRPSGKSCDEYPFASTWLGAEWVPATEWTCTFVPKGENDAQGGDLTKFTDENRLWRNPTGKVMDPTGTHKLGAYWVSVSNAPTSPPSVKQCQNHM